MSVPLGVILAGGMARRLGGLDKPLLNLAGRPLLSHVIDRLGPQTSGLAISANGNPARFERFAFPVLPDVPEASGLGPLSGVLAGLLHAQARGHQAIVTVPSDTPFLPLDLVRGLRSAAYAQDAAFAFAEARRAAGQYRAHPVCALWPVSGLDALRDALSTGSLAVGRFLDRAGAARIAFPAEDRDPFFNINTPDDLATAEAMMQSPPL